MDLSLREKHPGLALLMVERCASSEILPLLEKSEYGLVATNQDSVLPTLLASPLIRFVFLEMHSGDTHGETLTRHIKTCKRLRQQGACPLIAVVASSHASLLPRLMQVGADDCLVLPASQTMVNKMLERAGSPEAGGADFTADNFPVLAADAFAVFCELMGGDIETMLEVYYRNARTYLDDMAASLRSQQYYTLNRAAHSLKSASKQIGALRLAEMARRVEFASESSVPSKNELLEKLCRELGAVYERTQQRIRGCAGQFTAKQSG